MAAVLIVHEFSTPLTEVRRQRGNAADLDAFLARLGAAERTSAADGSWLAGPYTVPGNAHLPGDLPIYIGKLTTTITGASATAPAIPARGTSTARPQPAATERHETPEPQRNGRRIALPIAAVLLDLGYPARTVKAVPILARTASLLGHLAEEQQDPIGFQMAATAEEAGEYERPS